MSPERITQKYIAEVAGVSGRTVSAVLKNEGGLSLKTRQRIQKIADDLGYFARELVTIGEIAVVLQRFDDPLYGETIETFTDLSRKEGWNVVLIPDAYGESSILPILKRIKPEAIIVFNPARQKQTRRFVGKSPLIVVGADTNIELPGDLARVDLDHRGAVESALNLLLELGHNRIAYASGFGFSLPEIEREQAYKEFMVRQKLNPILIDLIRNSTDDPFSFDHAYYRSKHGWLSWEAPQMPTAVIFENDNMAVGAMKAITERGLKIPEDISIVGFGGSKLTQYTRPKLATVAMSAEDLATSLYSLFTDFLSGDLVPSKRLVKVPLSLQIRESIGPLEL